MITTQDDFIVNHAYIVIITYAVKFYLTEMLVWGERGHKEGLEKESGWFRDQEVKGSSILIFQVGSE